MMVDLVLYLVSGYDYDLNKKQKKAIDLLSNILNQHFSQIKRQSYVDKINELENVLNEKEEEYLKIIKTKDETIETQYQKIEYLYKDIESKNKGLTIQQQNVFYYYLFNELGVNFGNSTKTHWAKLISNVNGRNEVNISTSFCRKKSIYDYRYFSSKNRIAGQVVLMYCFF